MIKQKIDADLKNALLAGDKTKAMVLRNVKSAILYVEVALNKRDQGLDDVETLAVLSKESKKRQEAADLFKANNVIDRAQEELKEKELIDSYLPEPLTEDEIRRIIDRVVQDLGPVNTSTMGVIISRVKQDAGPAADGALIAQLVRSAMGNQ